MMKSPAFALSAFALSAFALSAVLMAPTALAEELSAGLVTVQAQRLEEQLQYVVRRSYWGQVRASRQARVGFEVGGLLTDIPVREGDSFAAGDRLGSLRSSMQKSASELRRAQLQVSREDLRLAEDALQRLQELDAAGHAVERRIHEAEHALATGRARLEVARRQLEQAQVQLEQRHLIAPWDGVVQRRMLDEGAVVAPGQPVLHLMEQGAMEAEISVSAGIGKSLQPGRLYDLLLDERLVRAPLLRLSPALHSGSRTQQAFFALPEGAAIAGEGAQLQLSAVVPQPGYWVPVRSLVQLRKGLWGVLVADSSRPRGAATKPADAAAAGEGNPAASGAVMLAERIVEVIHVDRDFAYVSGTLHSGDRVITSGSGDLVAGQQVQLHLKN